MFSCWFGAGVVAAQLRSNGLLCIAFCFCFAYCCSSVVLVAVAALAIFVIRLYIRGCANCYLSIVAMRRLHQMMTVIFPAMATSYTCLPGETGDPTQLLQK